MKILLTGVAGTGKSTITKMLNARGIPAMDLHDIPGIFFWQDKATKEKIEYTPDHSAGWFDAADRICDIEKLKELLREHDGVIMSGSTSGSNQKDFFSLFDKIILLQADPDTLIHRMGTRTNTSGYGKTHEEKENNMGWQKQYDPLLLSLGAIPVSTEGGLDDAVERIIETIKGFKK